MKKILAVLMMISSLSAFANDSIFFCIEAETQLQAIQQMNMGFATAPHFTVNSLSSMGLAIKKEDVTSKSSLSFINDPKSQGFSKSAVVCVTINGKLSSVNGSDSDLPDKPPF